MREALVAGSGLPGWQASLCPLFALTVLDLLGLGTISSVAHYLRVGWDLIKEIHKSKLSRTYKTIPLQEINSIGIDEFSIKKGTST